jgi:putative transcriptional regulator
VASAVRAVFAESVRRERTARGWTQAELARKTGISKITVAAIEKQRTGTGLEVAALIAGVFGVSIGSLVDDGQEESRG